MIISSEKQALEILNDRFRVHYEHEEAIHYLAERPSETAVKGLVKALQDDDFGIRWDASIALAGIGERALPELLRALMDPKLVGDPRLRRGAFRVLHRIHGDRLPKGTYELMEALRGPAADILSMEKAYKLYCELDPKLIARS